MKDNLKELILYDCRLLHDLRHALGCFLCKYVCCTSCKTYHVDWNKKDTSL
jgi:hypothetical protein